MYKMSARVVSVEKGKKEVTVLDWGNPDLYGFDNKGAIFLDRMHISTFHAGYIFDGFVRVDATTKCVQFRFAHESLSSKWYGNPSKPLNEINQLLGNKAHKPVTSGRLVLGIGYENFQQELRQVFPLLAGVVAPQQLPIPACKSSKRKRNPNPSHIYVETGTSAATAEPESMPATPPSSHSTLAAPQSIHPSHSNQMAAQPAKRMRLESFSSVTSCEFLMDEIPSMVPLLRSSSGTILENMPTPVGVAYSVAASSAFRGCDFSTNDEIPMHSTTVENDTTNAIDSGHHDQAFIIRFDEDIDSLFSDL